MVTHDLLIQTLTGDSGARRGLFGIHTAQAISNVGGRFILLAGGHFDISKLHPRDRRQETPVQMVYDP